MDKEKIFNDLKHKQYGVFGDHSAVEICEWNKKALRGQGVCYKQKFYNADCHRCAQITPAVIWCHQNCIFCWRPANYMKEHVIKGKLDEPKEIIENLFKERIKLLSGFGGNLKVDPKLFKEAQKPSHVAISLAGEPTIYPKIGELINELKKDKEIKTIFLVTNGLEPEKLKEMNEKDQLPTQLYLSIESCNPEMHKKINKPKTNDSWEKFNKTLDLMPELKCRRVVRFTLIKGLNDSLDYIDEFIKMFERTKTDFIEVKSYMHLGESRENLEKENSPTHDEVEEYSKEIENRSKDYEIVDRQVASRIVLLKNKNSKYKNFIKD